MSGAQFVLSGPSWQHLPDVGAAEFAFCGRSNVGKSSLLGAVLGAPRLVRTSRTPGRTQLLNLFYTGPIGPRLPRWAACDLPGYGYARMPHLLRQRMQQMLAAYLQQRRPLVAVVMVMDARLGQLSPLDGQMFAQLAAAGRRAVVVLAKADKVAKAQRQPRAAALARQLVAAAGEVSAPPLRPLAEEEGGQAAEGTDAPMLFVSAHSGENIRQLRALLDRLAAAP